MTAPTSTARIGASGASGAPAIPGASATSASVAPTTASATGRRRRAGAWAAIAVVLLVMGLVGAWLAAGAQWSERDALDPEGVGPAGTRAIANLLREQGVQVQIMRSHEEAVLMLEREPATLVTPDSPYLSDDVQAAMFAAAADVVLIGPRTRSIELLFPDARAAGFGADEPVAPQCTLPDAQRAGPVVIDRAWTAPNATVCYPAGTGHGLLVRSHDGRDGDSRAVVVDGRALFANDRLADNGNAALGLNLMGRHATLVWYVPDAGDSDLAAGDRTLGELTPGWVTPVMTLLVVAALAAALWRGRRFGPLVVERLPVTVRAAETMEGRARLYARGRDHVHAADALRMGATERLARTLGLSPAADVHEVADAAAAVIGAPREHVRGVLVDDLPDTDAELMSISDRLRDLERAVRAAVGHERRTT